jgi:hypothetical protein
VKDLKDSLNIKPQQIKMHLLVLQLPRTQDLQPFIIVFSITIKGHNNMMWSQDVEFKRQLLANCANSALSMVMETVLYFKNGLLDEVLDLLAQWLGVFANSNLVVWMRNSCLRTFNMLLPGSYKLRELLEREFADDIEQLVDFLYTCGDYDTQSSLVETLLRFTSKANRPKLAMTWFRNYPLVQSLFVRIN